MEKHRPDEEAMQRQTYVSHQYFQLKSGHAVTDTFLRYIENRGNGRCWECDFRSQIDVHHIMFICTA